MGNESVAILILIVGALAALMIIIKTISLGKRGVDAGINKSKTMLRTVSKKVEIEKQKALEIKLNNIVADELVRELVRKAIREGIDPDIYQPCNDCLGKGCTRCNNRGWLKL